MVAIAQLVEPRIVIPKVVGSIPTGHPSRLYSVLILEGDVSMSSKEEDKDISISKNTLDKLTAVATKLITKCDDVNKLPCCNYVIKKGPGPVFWNSYNQCIQCHNCGRIWIPSNLNGEVGNG
jgi:hypothetical protein